METRTRRAPAIVGFKTKPRGQSHRGVAGHSTPRDVWGQEFVEWVTEALHQSAQKLNTPGHNVEFFSPSYGSGAEGPPHSRAGYVAWYKGDRFQRHSDRKPGGRIHAAQIQQFREALTELVTQAVKIETYSSHLKTYRSALFTPKSAELLPSTTAEIADRIRTLSPGAYVAFEKEAAAARLAGHDDATKRAGVDYLIYTAGERLGARRHYPSVEGVTTAPQPTTVGSQMAFAPPSHAAKPTAPVVSADPLRAARERGMQYAIEEWSRDTNLTLKDAALRAGCSDGKINRDRKNGRLYALVLPNKDRMLRYPAWQFDLPEPARLAQALAPFVEQGASCWVIHNFMSRPLEALDGATPQAWIRDSSKSLQPLVDAINARYTHDQGAS